MKHGRWVILTLTLSLYGCVSSGNELVSAPSPKPDQLIVPTITSGEDFECWTAPTRSNPIEMGSGTGQLILITRTYGDGNLPQGVHLIRFDFSGADYSLLASDIADYVPDPVRQSLTSPDERYLWYARYRGPSDDIIFVYNLTNDSLRQVPFPNRVSMIAVDWSADGKCLIDTGSGVAYRLADGALQQKTIPGRYQSPDGRWWAVEADRGIRIIDMEWNYLQDDALQLSIKNDSSGRVWLGLIRWSPSGNVVAFAYGKAHGYYFSTVRLIFLGQDRVASYMDISLPGVASLNWSPDGHRLLLAEGKLGVKHLHIYDIATGETTVLPQPERYGGAAPVWSPDGKQIAFVSEDGRSLYVMNADGTGLLQLQPLPSNADNAASSPSVVRIFWVP